MKFLLIIVIIIIIVIMVTNIHTTSSYLETTRANNIVLVRETPSPKVELSEQEPCGLINNN